MSLTPSGGMFSQKDGSGTYYLIIELFDTVPAHLAPSVPGRPDVHPPGPFEGMVEIILVHLAHELQVQFGLALGLIVQP